MVCIFARVGFLFCLSNLSLFFTCSFSSHAFVSHVLLLAFCEGLRLLDEIGSSSKKSSLSLSPPRSKAANVILHQMSYTQAFISISVLSWGNPNLWPASVLIWISCPIWLSHTQKRHANRKCCPLEPNCCQALHTLMRPAVLVEFFDGGGVILKEFEQPHHHLHITTFVRL